MAQMFRIHFLNLFCHMLNSPAMWTLVKALSWPQSTTLSKLCNNSSRWNSNQYLVIHQIIALCVDRSMLRVLNLCFICVVTLLMVRWAVWVIFQPFLWIIAHQVYVLKSFFFGFKWWCNFNISFFFVIELNVQFTFIYLSLISYQNKKTLSNAADFIL